MSFHRHQILFALSLLSILVASCGKHEEDCERGSCLMQPGGSPSAAPDDDEAGSGSGGVAGDGGASMRPDIQCLPALCPRGYCVDDECVECVFDDSSRSCKDSSKPICLEGNTCVTVESQQIPFTDPSSISGSRLKVRYVKASDGAFMPLDFWDSELEVFCSFSQAPDGATRCMPQSRQVLDLYFADESCSVPFVEVEPSCSTRYAMAPDSREIYRITDTLIATGNYIYGRNFTECQAYSVGLDHETFVAELVPTSDFVLGTIREEARADGMEVDFIDGSDGSSQLVGLRNDAQGGCAVIDGHCLPSSTGAEGYHVDASCRTPVAGRVHVAPVDGMPQIITAKGGDSCAPQLYLFEPGEAVPADVPLYSASSQEGCVEVERDPSYVYFKLAAPIPFSAFPPVELSREGNGNFLARRLVDSDGKALSAVLDFWDTTRGESVLPVDTDDGDVVAFPTEFGYTYGDYFSGPACDAATELVEVDSCLDHAPRLSGRVHRSCNAPLNLVHQAYETGAFDELGYRWDSYDEECEPREESSYAKYYLLGDEITNELPQLEMSIDD